MIQSLLRALLLSATLVGRALSGQQEEPRLTAETRST